MARGVNKVLLIGNLGADPEVRAMPSGMTVANFRIATSEKWKDKESGEEKERTEWHSCAAFGRTGEVCGEYLKKGSKVYIEGKLQTRKWQDKNGNDRYTTEVIVNEMQMLDSRASGPAAERQEAAPRGRGRRPAAAPERSIAEDDGDRGGLGEFDDDPIPF